MGGTWSRGNTCCQLFVTDKGFIYVVPMKCKSEVLSAIKQFAKEVGAPDAIVSETCSKLLVKWKDQSESWVKLSELKESHPVETTEFAKSRGIDDESTFTWWVPHTLKKRNAIISAMKMRLPKTTHKYGIKIPTSIDHAMEHDRKNGQCGKMH